jgi:alkylresorcinol/alkylpyrone synthase
MADLVVSGLFGDGAGALVAAGGQAVEGPRVVASRSEMYPDSGDTLGWRLGSDGFRIVLTSELADVVERRLSGSVSSFLAGHGLTVEEITTWVYHPAARRSSTRSRTASSFPTAPWN